MLIVIYDCNTWKMPEIALHPTLAWEKDSLIMRCAMLFSFLFYNRLVNCEAIYEIVRFLIALPCRQSELHFLQSELFGSQRHNRVLLGGQS